MEKKMDLTAKLPDEVLMDIFDCLPSLSDKLRLESVSRRFQRCLISLLNTRPIRLSAQALNVYSVQLNGYSVPQNLVSTIVQTLAKKAKFSNIIINKSDVVDILSALVSSDNDCLQKVVAIHLGHETGCSQALLQETVAKCPKLSEVRLEFHVGPLTSDHAHWTDPDWDLSYLCLMDLSEVLKDKALSQLDLSLQYFTQEQLIPMFQSLKPNKLKKLHLFLYEMSLDMDILMSELGGTGGAWARLEEIKINCFVESLRVDTLFSSLAHLPALRKCNLRFRIRADNEELVTALTSLFTNQTEVTVSLHYLDCTSLKIFDPHHETGCDFVGLIRQVQAVHPDLRVGFGPSGTKLTLALGQVTFQRPLGSWIPYCDDPHCANCSIFYPTVISLLSSRADKRVRGIQQDVHLTSARLDRCRMGSVVTHLNQGTGRVLTYNLPWAALHAEINEAHNLVTITFETAVGGLGEFDITVDCGHCLSYGCFGCIDV